MSSVSGPAATLSLDLDNLWCYQRSFGLPGWEGYPSFLNDAVPRILDCLEELNLRLTVFVVGRDAASPEHGALFTESARRGHEFGNHTFDHDAGFPYLPERAIIEQLELTRSAVENACGQTTRGFRGPAFGLSRTLLEVLADQGYRFDASTCPSSVGAAARLYHRMKASGMGTSAALQQHQYGSLKNSQQSLNPYLWETDSGVIVELPVTTLPLLRLPFHGTYLNLVADYAPLVAKAYFRTALNLCRLFGVTPSFLLHATDFLGADDRGAPLYLPGMKRPGAQKRAFMRELLCWYSQHFTVTPLGVCADALQSGGQLQSVKAEQLT